MIRLPGIGEKRGEALAAAGLHTPRDLLFRFPVSFRDYQEICAICDLTPGRMKAFQGEVAIQPKRKFSGKNSRVTVRIADGTGEIECVWFNQPYVAARLQPKTKWLFYGETGFFRGVLQANNPQIHQIGEKSGLEPVYPSIESVPQKIYREITRTAMETYLHKIKDFLPDSFRKKHNLIQLKDAILWAHCPPDRASLEIAKRRLSFEELLMTQLALCSERAAPRPGFSIPCGWREVQPLLAQMPFALTNAQRRVMEEIFSDLQTETAMARLVQGDVGSGKTALAYLALYAAVSAGYQGAMMAPTEILARQHYEGAKMLFSPLGVNLELLTGSLTAKHRSLARARAADGSANIVFGTHALISEGVEYKNLALVVTDEQHRFGVRQRAALGEKGEAGGISPNVLVMSATPIPRSLALILYGDLALSAVDELPPGRTPIRTNIVPERKRKDMYEFIRKQIKNGGQAYVVCPLVEESEIFDEASAVETHEALAKIFPEYRVGLVHGRQNANFKNEELSAFASGEISILVSTTVIEVGVNVPNANIMLIEGADRFGLAQLHQLRGRVGRGQRESFCFLMGESEKLRVLASTNDGFIVAQKDLEIRGPGDLLGTRQSGVIDGRLAALAANASMLAETSAAAEEIISGHQSAESKMLLDTALARFNARLKKIARN